MSELERGPAQGCIPFCSCPMCTYHGYMPKRRRECHGHVNLKPSLCVGVQGNCASPDGAAALNLPPSIAADVLPLRPWQCLLLVNETWLMVNSGHLWVENLYLKLIRQLVRPNFSFITAGALNAEFTWPAVHRSDMFITGVTFQGEHRGNARAITCDITRASFLADGTPLPVRIHTWVFFLKGSTRPSVTMMARAN